MENSTLKYEFNVETNSTTRNVSSTVHGEGEDKTQELIFIFQSIISSVGIVANATVVVVFMKHKKLRKKITNIFLINQVRTSFTYFSRNYSTVIECRVRINPHNSRTPYVTMHAHNKGCCYMLHWLPYINRMHSY